MLTISAEKKTEAKDEHKEYSRREYSYNSFTRSFHMPNDAKPDGIAAKYSDGVPSLTVPKNETKPKSSKSIPIS